MGFVGPLGNRVSRVSLSGVELSNSDGAVPTGENRWKMLLVISSVNHMYAVYYRLQGIPEHK